jgi:hypothetical protein
MGHAPAPLEMLPTTRCTSEQPERIYGWMLSSSGSCEFRFCLDGSAGRLAMAVSDFRIHLGFLVTRKFGNRAILDVNSHSHDFRSMASSVFSPEKKA